MDKRLKTALILVGVAVAVYLGYRWYQNRQSSSQGLGSNLNSAAPELVAGSSGPSSGLNYYAGSTTVDITEPVTSQKPVVGKIPYGRGDGPIPSKSGGPISIDAGAPTGPITPNPDLVVGDITSVPSPLSTTQFGGTGSTG